MSEIWNTLREFQKDVTHQFDAMFTRFKNPELERFNSGNWVNLEWGGRNIRRIHLDVVDARDTKGLWMMHLCMFPSLNNSSPIFGFDVIAGKNKVTGAFLDMSPTVNKNTAIQTLFNELSRKFQPSKERNLPEWAKNIFSDSMIAAGNVQDIEELNKIISIAQTMLHVYIDTVNSYTIDHQPIIDDIVAAQEYYAYNQRQNPHTPKVMKSLGLNEEDVEVFCKDVLFPPIH